MKNFGIQTPCKENWNAMTPTEKGAFCQQCASQVLDFTNKSNAEIKSIFRGLSGQKVCSKVNPHQIEALSADFEAWRMNSKRSVQTAMLFSLIVVFGLTLFSCTTEKEKKTILHMQQAISQSVNQSVSESISSQETVSILPIAEKIKPVEGYIIPDFITERDFVNIQTSDSINPYDVFIEREFTIMGMFERPYDFDAYLEQEAIETPVEYDENGIAIPTVFTSKAYPNPTVSTTTLEIALPNNDFTEIRLFDLGGKLIQTVFSGDLKRGTHSYAVDLTTLPAGMYIFSIHSATYTGTVRVSKI